MVDATPPVSSQLDQCKEGDVWVPSLARCLSSNVQYANRGFGRAGGSSRGGRGGIGGRPAGSRAWNPDNKNVNKNGVKTHRDSYCWTVCITALVSLLLNTWSSLLTL